MRTSLIISTYEKPAYLDLVLASIAWQMLATHIGYHQASAHLPADRLRRMLTDGPEHASERQALHDGNQILMKAWRVSGTSSEDQSRQDEA